MATALDLAVGIANSLNNLLVGRNEIIAVYTKLLYFRVFFHYARRFYHNYPRRSCGFSLDVCKELRVRLMCDSVAGVRGGTTRVHSVLELEPILE